MQEMLDQIKDAVNSTLTSAETGLQKDIDKLIASINDQVTGLLDDINNEINGKVDNIFDDIISKTDPWFKRLNKLVDLYNKVAGKINNVLDNPNHYLQVAMFYNQADSNFGLISNKKSDPTVFTGSNGNVGLYASSYTAELVAPAFKKYVAVSNVYEKKNGKVVVAENAASEIAKANSEGNFNKVMDGNTIRYSLPVSNLKKGLIYEIVYQGLDFHGVTSTQKFYITVK